LGVDELKQTAEGLGIPYLEMGAGFMMRLSVGYVVKKSFKLLLFLMGIALIVIFVLESKGIIVLNESALDQSITWGTEGFKYFVLWLRERLSSLKIAGGASAVAGFVVGLKIG
jgi:uncharacterized membrane protein (Fun14 family)